MQMQVRINACSRSRAEIPANIECLGLDHVAKEMLGVDRKVDQLEFFGRRQLLQSRDLTIRNCHQMTG
jgi:hypothetical protein